MRPLGLSRGPVTDYLSKLESKLQTIKALSVVTGVNGFFGQEALRFYSITGTLINIFNLTKSASVDERYITHILARSLFENYFWLIYIFDDISKKEERYKEMINSFKRDYNTLYNEHILPYKDQLEPPDPAWSSLTSARVNNIIGKIRNDYGDSLNYLYSIYRVTSFDTHGKNLNNIFQTAFNKTCNFPVLDLNYCFNLIANQYLVILKELQDKGEI